MNGTPLTSKSWTWQSIMVDELLPISKRVVRNKSCARRTSWHECHNRATLNSEPGEMMPQKNTIRRPSLKTTPRKTTLACIGVPNHPRLRCFNENGQAMVEIALVLPILLLVVTGILTFGLAFNNYVLLTEATGIGARTLAISRGATTDPCATAASAIIAAAPLLTPANLSFTFVLNGATYTGASCSSGSSTTGAAGNLVQGANAVVTVNYPCSLAVFGANYAPQCSLRAQMTEFVQ
jgi:Flp pilus assembly protein TadG